MLALALLVLRMPVTCWPVLEVDEVMALRLLRLAVSGLGVAVLPTVFLLMVFAPAVAAMPVSEADAVATEPFTVMEPMVLLLKATVPLLPEPMPKLVPPDPEVVIEIEPPPVPLPMVLPVTVPTFTEPACTKIPVHTPGSVVALLELVQNMFAMVFP